MFAGSRSPALLLLKRYRSTSAIRAKPKPRNATATKAATERNTTPESKKHRQLPKIEYHDPANLTLDFSKSNRQLFAQIAKESKHRVTLRYEEPAKEWSQAHATKNTLESMRKHILEASISLEDTLAPLQEGDLVLLSDQSTLLHLVVAVPQSLASNIFTFVNSEGSIRYGNRHLVKLRIPNVIPKKMLSGLELVTLEKKIKNIAPVGLPGSDFSWTKSTIPEQTEGEVAEDEQIGVLPGSASNSDDDFVVAHSMSELLKNNDVNTYIVPTSARKLYSSFLTKLSITSAYETAEFRRKLEYFNSVLQRDEYGDLITTSKSVPVFELFRMVTEFYESKAARMLADGSKEELEAAAALVKGQSALDKTKIGLGIPIPTKNADGVSKERIPISSYIAFNIALHRSNKRWRVNVQRSTKTPISVDIIPEKKTLMNQVALNNFKLSQMDHLIDFYARILSNGAEKELPRHHNLVMQIMKDYVAGNIAHNPELESVLGIFLNKIDKKLSASKTDDPRRFDSSRGFSKCKAYELVVALDVEGIVNPIVWSEVLQLPNTNTSQEADLFDEYFQYLDKKYPDVDTLVGKLNRRQAVEEDCEVKETFKNLSRDSDDFTSEDPMATVRTDFGNTPVYCIDSETAHEIDDGISLRKNGSLYVISIHVANPTSYLRRDSYLSQIAYEKGSTVYLPEDAYMMLPNIVSRLCGLNGVHKTRTIAIEFELDCASVDSYMEEVKLNHGSRPSDKVAKQVLDDIERSSLVKFYEVSNFPKGFTYKKVNDLLNDEGLVQRFVSGDLSPGSHEDNLFKLYHISSILRHVRLGLKGGLEVNQEKPKVSVDYTAEETPRGEILKANERGWQITLPKGDSSRAPVISVAREVDQDRTSKSQQLVSNFMIAGNFAGTVFAKNNNVPIIHRTQLLQLPETVKSELRGLTSKICNSNENLTVEEMSQYLGVMTSANFEVARKKHESLGLESYLNFTSPLRRYVDMVNHWSIQDHVLGKGTNNQSDLEQIASHLRSRELANKFSQRFSSKFWQGQFLKEYFSMLRQGLVANPIEFSFLLKSDPKHGDIRVEVLGFNDLSATIVPSEYVLKRFASGEYKVGHIIQNPNFHVVRLDYIEDEFAIELY